MDNVNSECAEHTTAAGGGNREYAKGRNKENFDGEAKKGDYISDRILIRNYIYF